jgi:hypothetical protein
MRFKEEYMQFLRPSRAWLVCALLTALCFTTVAASSTSNGREFSGYFDVSGVQEQGDLVQVTLHLQLFNFGNNDVKGAIVTLFDSMPGPSLQGSFAPVKLWKRQQPITLTQKFTVTKLEFGKWMMGPGQPNLIILVQDAKGRTLQRGAQVSLRPLVK